MTSDSGSASATFVAWNAEWRSPRSPAGRAMRRMMNEYAADVICLSETCTDLLDPAGYVITSEPDYGYRLVPGRRKVVLWSRQPWTEVDPVGDPGMPSGRFVAGKTSTPLGPLRIFGVCIPWELAHVATGRRDRAPWEDHRAYLDGLGRLARQGGMPASSVMLGDFNQTAPRTRAPQAVHDALLAALGTRLTLATAGPIAGLEALVIDHVAHGADLRPHDVLAIPRRLAGLRLTDHDGVAVRLARR